MAYNRWLSTECLAHHQIKGARWGVRNGPPYPLNSSISNGHKLIKSDGSPQGKKRNPTPPDITYTSRDYDKANDIYKTLSRKEKRYLMAPRRFELTPKEYVKPGEYDIPDANALKNWDPKNAYNVYSRIEQYKDVPVSVIDIWGNKDGRGAISIATRGGEQYRHQGYASRALESGIKYFYENPELEYLVWGVNKKNRPSIELAKKHGFKWYNDYGDGWESYVLDKEVKHAMAYNRWINNELEHHQVKGAHWGVHNGPPYPLDRSLSDGNKLLPKATGSPQTKKKYKTSEKTAHKRAERKARTNRELERARKLYGKDDISEAEIIALRRAKRDIESHHVIDPELQELITMDQMDHADVENYSVWDEIFEGHVPNARIEKKFVNGRPLTKKVRSRTADDIKAIEEAQKYDDQQHRRILNGANFLANTKTLGFKISRYGSDTDNGLPVKKEETSKDYDLKTINPGGKGTTLSGTNNCLLCTVAYDMRRRGYNVIARQRAPIELLYDIGDEDLSNMYKHTKTIRDESLKGITNKIKSQKNSRGSISCTWNGSNSGHVVAYEVNDGKVTLYDAQSGTRYDDPSKLFSDAHNFRAVRLDNLTPDYRLIKLAVE